MSKIAAAMQAFLPRKLKAHKRDRSPNRSRSGFTLVELMVVIAIIAAVIPSLVDRYVRYHEDQLAKLAADNISVLGVALAEYMHKNMPAVAAGLMAAPNYIDITQAQLVADGELSKNFSPNIPWGGNYNMRIWRIGAAAPYTMQGLVITNSAWVINGANRVDLARIAALKIGGNGGWTEVQATTPGPKGVGWSAPPSSNPITGLTPAVYDPKGGQLAYQANPSSIYDSTYLRLDGTNTMRGQLNMGSNPINNATDITGTGTITGQLVASNTDVTAANNISAVNSINAGANISAGGNVSAAVDITAANDIKASHDLTAANRVVATNDVEISTLTSRGIAAETPNTTSVKRLLPKLVEMTNTIVNAHGQMVTVPDCGGGTALGYILPNTAFGTVQNAMFGSQIELQGPSGGAWTVYALDASGNQIGVNSTAILPGNFFALVRTFCQY